MRNITTFIALLLTCFWGAKADNVWLTAPSGSLGTLQDGQYHYESDLLTAPAGTRTLRLTFANTGNDETTNNSLPYRFVCISEFYLLDADGTEFPLTVDNFSTNAQESIEGPMTNICDNETGQGNYWHSMWSAKPATPHFHYLEIDLSSVLAENQELGSYKLKWITRREKASPSIVAVTTGATHEDVDAEALAFVENAYMHDDADLVAQGGRPVVNTTTTSEAAAYFIKGKRGYLVAGEVVRGDSKWQGINSTGDNTPNHRPDLKERFMLVEYKGKTYLYNIGKGTFVNKKGTDTESVDPVATGVLPHEVAVEDATAPSSPYFFRVRINGNMININSSGSVITNYETEDEGNRWAFYKSELPADYLNAQLAKATRALTISDYKEAVADAQRYLLLNPASTEATTLKQAISDNAVADADDATAIEAKTAAINSAIATYSAVAGVKIVDTQDAAFGTYNASVAPAEGYTWESNLITLPVATNQITFKVIETNTKQAKDGYQYFSMSEFEVYDAEGTKVELVAEDFSTNAQETSEGKISNLCDGSTEQASFFHSKWSSGGVYDYHRISIQLPEPMQTFSLKFKRRNHANIWNVPRIVAIGSAAEQEQASIQNVLQPRAIEAINAVEAYKASCDFSTTGDLNKYTISEVEYDNFMTEMTSAATTEPLTEEMLRAVIEQAPTAKQYITINQPADNSFIRVRSTMAGNAAMPYLRSENHETTSRASFGEGGTPHSIFFYAGGKLLAYESGYYLANNSADMIAYNGVTEGIDFSFREATDGTTGCYNVLYNNGGRVLYCKPADGQYYADGGKTATHMYDAKYNFWLEEVTALPLTVGAAGYATFNAPVATQIPAEVTAYVGQRNGNRFVLTQVTGAIPANTPLIVAAGAGTYSFNVLSTADALTQTNELTGTVAAEAAVANSLTLQNPNDVIGLYPYSGTEMKGFKAYLAGASAVEGLAFDFGTTTGIDGIDASKADNTVYDLSGRRVKNASKGFYIVNGKKVLVK